MYILAEHGLDVRVVKVPDGKDPDEFLSSNPAEKFEEALRNSKPLILQHIEFLRNSLSDFSTRRKALNELLEGFSKLKPDDIAPYKAQISDATKIPPSELNKMILSDFSQKNSNYVQIQHEKPENKIEYNVLEDGLCSMLFHYPECRLKINPEDVYRILKNPINQETALALLTENFEEVQELWTSSYDNEKFAVIARGDKFCEELGNLDIKRKWEKICNEINISIITRRNAELRYKIENNTITPEELNELSNLMNHRVKFSG